MFQSRVLRCKFRFELLDAIEHRLDMLATRLFYPVSVFVQLIENLTRFCVVFLAKVQFLAELR